MAKRHRVWTVGTLQEDRKLISFFPFFKEEEARTSVHLLKRLGFKTVVVKDSMSMSPAGVTSWMQRTTNTLGDSDVWETAEE